MEALNFTQITPVWQQLKPALMPIETDAQHARALELLAPVWEAVSEDAAHPLGGLLSLMLARISEYEDGRWPLTEGGLGAGGTPAENLRYLLDQRELSQRALAEATGIGQATLSRVLSGERELTARHIRVLSDYFGVDTSYFLEG